MLIKLQWTCSKLAMHDGLVVEWSENARSLAGGPSLCSGFLWVSAIGSRQRREDSPYCGCLMPSPGHRQRGSVPGELREKSHLFRDVQH